MNSPLHDRLPRQDAILGVHVLEAFDFAGNAHSKAAANAGTDVVLVHVLKGRRRRSFSEIDGFILAVGVPKHGKASTANARVVHANHADAKRRPNQGVNGIALIKRRHEYGFTKSYMTVDNGDDAASGEILAVFSTRTYPSRQQISPYGAAFSALTGDATDMARRGFLENFLNSSRIDGDGLRKSNSQEQRPQKARTANER